MISQTKTVNKRSPAIISQQRSLLHCKKSALLYSVPSLFFGSTYDTTPVAGCQWSTQALCPFRCLVEIGSSTHGPQIPLLLSPNRPVFLISALLFAFIGFHSRITEHGIIVGRLEGVGVFYQDCKMCTMHNHMDVQVNYEGASL